MKETPELGYCCLGGSHSLLGLDVASHSSMVNEGVAPRCSDHVGQMFRTGTLSWMVQFNPKFLCHVSSLFGFISSPHAVLGGAGAAGALASVSGAKVQHAPESTRFRCQSSSITFATLVYPSFYVSLSIYWFLSLCFFFALSITFFVALSFSVSLCSSLSLSDMDRQSPGSPTVASGYRTCYKREARPMRHQLVHVPPQGVRARGVWKAAGAKTGTALPPVPLLVAYAQLFDTGDYCCANCFTR